jgi:hypothetical protein
VCRVPRLRAAAELGHDRRVKRKVRLRAMIQAASLQCAAARALASWRPLNRQTKFGFVSRKHRIPAELGGDLDHPLLSPRDSCYALTFFLLTLSQTNAQSSAILLDELDAGSSEDSFNYGQGRRITCVLSGFNIRDRIAMQLGRLGKIPNGPI